MTIMNLKAPEFEAYLGRRGMQFVVQIPRLLALEFEVLKSGGKNLNYWEGDLRLYRNIGMDIDTTTRGGSRGKFQEGNFLKIFDKQKKHKLQISYKCRIFMIYILMIWCLIEPTDPA